MLSTGTITAANLIGTLAGQPLSALVGEINAGNAYVNVHTNDGQDPTNEGPGDFPGGEIRGQMADWHSPDGDAECIFRGPTSGLTSVRSSSVGTSAGRTAGCGRSWLGGQRRRVQRNSRRSCALRHEYFVKAWSG